MKKYLLLLLLTSSLFSELKVGSKAPSFTLKTLDKHTSVTLKNFQGNVVLVNLWASWCKGCKKEMPEFFKLQKSYPKGFKLLAVSVDVDASKSEKLLQSVEKKVGFKTPFVTLHDVQKSVAKAYQCQAMPSSFLIDKKGVIRNVIIGSLNANDIEALKKEINTLQ